MTKVNQRQLAEADVIATLRLILATCVQQYGVLNMLVLTRQELEAAGTGTLSVQDRSDGSIVLRVKGAKPVLRLQ